jgi:queuine tRNA-ribosyltransferase
MFKIVHDDAHTQARLGQLTLAHGVVSTPIFMPVGTRGTIKGLTPDQVHGAGVQMLLANTYHMLLRPGSALVAEWGGLHEFMQWDGPILTDSGGFQVFSLTSLAKVDDAGVTFKSHIDGSAVRLDPETAIRVQNELGADVIMALDQCPPLPCPKPQLEAAVERSCLWARRCHEAHRREDQLLFGIVQGGVDRDLRLQCAEYLTGLGFPGYAIGGLSVGETHDEMCEVLSYTASALPADRPRYLMGVGMPRDIVAAVRCGVDMFDCVLPTRNGRNAYAFTASGPLKMRNEKHKHSQEPLEAGCDCYACTRFTRGYIRHLFVVEEMLGPILTTIHNLRFFQRLMTRIRALIELDRLDDIYAEFPVTR